MSDSKYRNSVPPKPPGSTSRPHPASSTKAASPSSAPAKTGATPQPVPHAGDNQKSGRVAYDARGNPVWEWQTSTGVFEQNVSTQRLKKLEATELSFADTQPVPTIGKGAAAAKQKVNSREDTGFNPYNSDGPINPQTDRRDASHPALVHKKPPPQKTAPRRVETPKPTGMWDKLKSKF